MVEMVTQVNGFMSQSEQVGRMVDIYIHLSSIDSDITKQKNRGPEVEPIGKKCLLHGAEARGKVTTYNIS